jgi:hypothetical protein
VATLVLWAVVLGMAAAMLVIFRYVRTPRTGLLVDVQDLTGTDRDNGSRMLSSEIAQLLSPSQDTGSDELIFESTTDLEGRGSASIRPLAELPGLDAILAATANVAIGPIQFTPAGLLTLLRTLVKPRYETTMTGALMTQGTRTVIRVQLAEANGAILPGADLQFAQEGAEARKTILQKVAAATIILRSNGRGLTSSAPSLQCVLEGISRLQGVPDREKSEEKLRITATAFQTA